MGIGTAILIIGAVIGARLVWIETYRKRQIATRREQHALPECCEHARYMQHECDDPNCQVGPTCRVDRLARWHAEGLGLSESATRHYVLDAIRSWQAFAFTKPRDLHPIGTLVRQHLLGMRAGKSWPCMRPLDPAGFCTIHEPPEVLLACELPRRWPDEPPIGPRA